jgi:hypothetical protein
MRIKVLLSVRENANFGSGIRENENIIREFGNRPAPGAWIFSLNREVHAWSGASSKNVTFYD